MILCEICVRSGQELVDKTESDSLQSNRTSFLSSFLRTSNSNLKSVTLFLYTNHHLCGRCCTTLRRPTSSDALARHFHQEVRANDLSSASENIDISQFISYARDSIVRCDKEEVIRLKASVEETETQRSEVRAPEMYRMCHQPPSTRSSSSSRNQPG